MARIVDIDVGNKEKLCSICKALSVPARIDILKLIENKGMSISEISEELNIPQSSVTFHIKVLEQADLINIEERPGMRGPEAVHQKDRLYQYQRLSEKQ